MFMQLLDHCRDAVCVKSISHLAFMETARLESGVSDEGDGWESLGQV